MMKKAVSALLIITLLLSLFGCTPAKEEPVTSPTEEQTSTPAPTEEPTRAPKENVAKVIMLFGQSNAVGATLYEPLKKLLDKDRYQTFSKGFENVRICYYCEAGGADGVNTGKNINYKKVDTYTTDTLFKKTRLGMTSWTSSMFGPEMGLAEYLTSETPDDTYYIIKVAKGAVSINSSWVEGTYCYENMEKIVDICMNVLKADGYTPEICGILWMQGEQEGCSATESLKYYEYQSKLVNDLREKYAEYAPYGGIPFIDAGISDYWSYYKNINKAKKEFADSSDLNYYFDTMALGLEYKSEPAGSPDLCHFDSLSVIALGQEFGKYLLEAYNKVK